MQRFGGHVVGDPHVVGLSRHLGADENRRQHPRTILEQWLTVVWGADGRNLKRYLLTSKNCEVVRGIDKNKISVYVSAYSRMDGIKFTAHFWNGT